LGLRNGAQLRLAGVNWLPEGPMPTELRKIVFSRNDLLEAFNDRPQRKKEDQLPDGNIEDVHVYQKFGGGVKLLVDIRDNEEERIKRFSLEPAAISDVLLHYCTQHQIPVSMKADKYLEVIGDNIALSQKIRGQEAFEDNVEDGTSTDGA
jgi:hypothetical protein